MAKNYRKIINWTTLLIDQWMAAFVSTKESAFSKKFNATHNK
jgi:hypothetical protein